jgi:hypothetical protein
VDHVHVETARFKPRSHALSQLYLVINQKNSDSQRFAPKRFSARSGAQYAIEAYPIQETLQRAGGSLIEAGSAGRMSRLKPSPEPSDMKKQVDIEQAVGLPLAHDVTQLRRRVSDEFPTRSRQALER